MIERAATLAFRGLSIAVEASPAIPADRREAAAVYLIVTIGNVPAAVAGRVMGCSRQNISKMIRRFETARDDAAIDAALTAIEDRLGAA